MLARDLGDCRDNLRNSRSVFLIVLREDIKEMEKSNIMIRLEKKEEYQKVENLVRESFWNVYRPGCLEHYVLHQLRNDQHSFQNWIL